MAAEYAARFGFTYYTFDDQPEWAAERRRLGLWVNFVGSYRRFRADSWPQVKFQAIREVLPRHRWVLYLDADTFFTNEARSEPLSVEAMLATWPPRIELVAPVSGSGFWNTDSLLVKNTRFGRQFLRRTWELWDGCPNCARQGEQCYLNIALFETLMAHMHHLMQRGAIAETVGIERYDEQYSCCDLLQLCTQRNPRIVRSPQHIYMCITKWNSFFGTVELPRTAAQLRMRFLALNDPRAAESGNLTDAGRFRHPRVRRFDFRRLMGLRHPVKDIPPEEC